MKKRIQYFDADKKNEANRKVIFARYLEKGTVIANKPRKKEVIL